MKRTKMPTMRQNIDLVYDISTGSQKQEYSKKSLARHINPLVYTKLSGRLYLKKTRMKRNQIQSPSSICVVKDTSTITHVGTHMSHTNLISVY